MTDLSRRGLLGMLGAGAAAAIIRTPGLIMPIKGERIVMEPRYIATDGVRFMRCFVSWLGAVPVVEMQGSLDCETWFALPGVEVTPPPFQLAPGSVNRVDMPFRVPA